MAHMVKNPIVVYDVFNYGDREFAMSISDIHGVHLNKRNYAIPIKEYRPRPSFYM